MGVRGQESGLRGPPLGVFSRLLPGKSVGCLSLRLSHPTHPGEPTDPSEHRSFHPGWAARPWTTVFRLPVPDHLASLLNGPAVPMARLPKELFGSPGRNDLSQLSDQRDTPYRSGQTELSSSASAPRLWLRKASRNIAGSNLEEVAGDLTHLGRTPSPAFSTRWAGGIGGRITTEVAQLSPDDRRYPPDPSDGSPSRRALFPGTLTRPRNLSVNIDLSPELCPVAPSVRLVPHFTCPRLNGAASVQGQVGHHM